MLQAEVPEDILVAALVDILVAAPEDPEEEGGINFPLFFAEILYKNGSPSVYFLQSI